MSLTSINHGQINLLFLCGNLNIAVVLKGEANEI
jgi:hypothetical protein